MLNVCTGVTLQGPATLTYPLAQYPYAQGTIVAIDDSNLNYQIQVRMYLRLRRCMLAGCLQASHAQLPPEMLTTLFGQIHTAFLPTWTRILTAFGGNVAAGIVYSQNTGKILPPWRGGTGVHELPQH